jgi:hypothetical protein
MVHVHLVDPGLAQHRSWHGPSVSFLSVIFIMTFLSVSVCQLGELVRACVWGGFGSAGSQQQGNRSSSRRQ